MDRQNPLFYDPYARFYTFYAPVDSQPSQSRAILSRPFSHPLIMSTGNALLVGSAARNAFSGLFPNSTTSQNVNSQAVTGYLLGSDKKQGLIKKRSD